ERSSVLGTDKDEFKMEVYRFSDDFGKEGQDVTLRFDLTVPLSRVVAAYPDLIKPFKRYQYGKVFRKEKPQSGRYREFAQLDADIVGSDSVLADVETIQVMYQAMKSLDINNFIVRFNNRKILNGLPALAGFEEKKTMDVFRVLDKLEKVGLEATIKELQRQPDNKFDETVCALSGESVSEIRKFLDISGDPISLIKQLRELFKGIKIAEEGISECEQIINSLNELSIPEKNWQFDLSIARGLGYYTGPVFETTLTDLPGIGSVFSGGRYDELVMRYTGEKIPATGASVGVDRLITALEKLGKLGKTKSTAKVLIAMINKKLEMKIIKLAQRLRGAGIGTEIYLGGSDMLKAQVVYAAKREIPFMIILGEEEDRVGKLKLKNMDERKEFLLTEKELIDRLR
ncbi:MAG: histidine--tRNA ligase, partial [Candidatus Portnoybacteria bacterium]